MTCDYAACPRPATARAAGWRFCPAHLIEHHYILNGQELPDLPREIVKAPCGTAAANRRHQRAGERPCPDCLEAARVDRVLRKERREQRAAV